MSTRRDPIDLVRESNPVPDPERLPGLDPDVARSLAREPAPARPRRRRRRPVRGILVAAVFLALAGTVAAAATGVFSPDPADVEAVLDESAGSADVHLPGWRPELAAETVWCMYEDGGGAETSVSEFPLDRPLTVELLVAECAGGNDAARGQTTAPEAFTLCRGTFTPAAYREMLAGGGTVLAGSASGPGPGFPVVLAWRADCEDTRLETSWPVELTALGSLAAVNEAREVGLELQAASARACLGREEADALALSARDRLGDRWLLLEWRLDVTPECYQAILDPTWGTIAVVGDDTPPVAAGEG